MHIDIRRTTQLPSCMRGLKTAIVYKPPHAFPEQRVAQLSCIHFFVLQNLVVGFRFTTIPSITTVFAESPNYACYASVPSVGFHFTSIPL